jgi:hypothetical protein
MGTGSTETVPSLQPGRGVTGTDLVGTEGVEPSLEAV